MNNIRALLSVGTILLSGFSAAKIIPSDGHWRTYDDPAIGSGINIRTQGDITMVTVFTYREDGSPVWYFATGEIDDNGVFIAPLGETKNGEFLFNNSPQTAEIVDPGKTIELVFNATETGTLSINDSEPKPIHTYRFGVDGIETEQLTTDSGDFYRFPDVTGQWAVGSPSDDISLSLDLHIRTGSVVDPPDPNHTLYFSDEFDQDTLSYSFICPTKNASSMPFCKLDTRSFDPATDELAAQLSRLYVFIDDIGVNTMTFHLQPEDDDSYSREHPIYQAFRLDADFEENAVAEDRTFPVEGHWRTPDDPEIGSGINYHCQGDIVMMTVFTYDDNGLPIWYMATGELNLDEITGRSDMNVQMFSTNGGSPIESSQPVSAEVDQVENIQLRLMWNQVVGLTFNDEKYKDVFNYNFGYADFQASERQQNTSDPLKIATPEGWWLMAEENAASSLLLHLVKNTEKLTPPIPTDWVYFENYASSSDRIAGIQCPTDYVFQWARCLVDNADDNDDIIWYLPMESMGATTWRMGYENSNIQSTGYYMVHRINPPMQP